MLMDDSDHYDIFSEEERSELIFKLFQHLTLGGPLNQYEDDIGPYVYSTACCDVIATHTRHCTAWATALHGKASTPLDS